MAATNSCSVDEAAGVANFMLIESLKAAAQAVGRARWELSGQIPREVNEESHQRAWTHLSHAEKELADALTLLGV